MARPKKTLNDLPKNWKQIILDIKKVGGSDVEVRVALDISTDLWDRFKKEIDEFSETIKKGTDLCEAWWLEKGRQLENKQFNAVLWYMNMKNRFGWKDKSEFDQNVKIESLLSKEQIDAIFTRRAKKDIPSR